MIGWEVDFEGGRWSKELSPAFIGACRITDGSTFIDGDFDVTGEVCDAIINLFVDYCTGGDGLSVPNEGKSRKACR